MKGKLENLAAWLLFSGILIYADQYTKKAAAECLRGRPPFVLIPGIFEFLYSENRGAAFGILQGRQVFFFAVAAAALAASGAAMYRLPDFSNSRYHLLKLCISMITAGAAGNMIDRISRGYVVDFLYFKLINFPVFNVADIFVTCAAALLIILVLFYYQEEELECLRFGGKEQHGSGNHCKRGR